MSGLDLACYEREYAPQQERDAARTAHLAQWPEAIDAAIDTLDQLSAPVAAALADGVRGLPAGIPATADDRVRRDALAAHTRLVAHIDQAVADGPRDAALGTAALAALMSSADAMPVDLDRLSERADAERDRLTARLAESCARVDPDRPALEVARDLVRDHPDADGVIEAARGWTELAIAFTRDQDLVPYDDGECRVGLAPESRRWAMAMMSPAGPAEPDGPSWYHITPPEASWPKQDIEEWLQVFSATTLPGITVHEVAPGHFSHGRAIRRAPTVVRRTLHSEAFVEGWAHYAEELSVEEGFCADDPQVRDRRLARGAGPRHPAGLRHRRAHRGHDGDRRCPPVRGGHAPGRGRGPVRGAPGHLRPDLRPLHLGQAGDHGAARPGQAGVGRRLLAAQVPLRDARARLAPARPARHRRRPRLSRRVDRGHRATAYC